MIHKTTIGVNVMLTFHANRSAVFYNRLLSETLMYLTVCRTVGRGRNAANGMGPLLQALQLVSCYEHPGIPTDRIQIVTHQNRGTSSN